MRNLKIALIAVVIIGVAAVATLLVRNEVSAATSVNIASQATITASSQNTYMGQTAAKVADGVAAGYPGDYSKEWATYGGKTGSWINFSWSTPKTVSKIVLYDRPNTDDQITAATIAFSNGTSISTGALPNNGSALTLSFSARQITWAKITVTGVSATTRNVGLCEAQVWTADSTTSSSSATVPPSTTTSTVRSTTTTVKATTTTAPSTTSTTVPSGSTIQVTTNLQAAINAAPNGSTIYVPAGSWGGATINNRSNLTIYGSRTASIIGTLEIGGSSSNIVIHDVTLKDSYSTDWNPGIQITSLKGGHFYNMEFVGMGHSAINAANSSVNWDANITNVEVDHNNVYGPVGEYGFYVGRGCYYWNLHDNSIGQCVGKTTPPHAFYIQDSAYITVSNNYAYGTTKSNGFAYKAAVDSYGQGHSHDVTFTNNKSDGNYGGLWLVATVNCTASGNQFLNNTNQAVQFWANNSNITLKNNTWSSQLYGIVFSTDALWSSNVHLIGNTNSAPVPLSLNGGPSSMIVESTGNNW